MTIWISRALSWFIFERLEILWAWHMHPSKNLWLFEYAESFRVEFRACRYIMLLNRRFEWNVMTFEFLRPSVVHFRASRYIMSLSHTNESTFMAIWIFWELTCSISSVSIYYELEYPCEKLWPFDFVESFRCSISSVSIYYVPESVFCVKS